MKGEYIVIMDGILVACHDYKGVGRVGDALVGCTAVAAGSPDVFAG
jgi:hypothetical protein